MSPLTPRDGLFVGGTTLILAGLWWIYEPAALVGAGTALIGLHFYLTKTHSR